MGRSGAGSECADVAVNKVGRIYVFQMLTLFLVRVLLISCFVSAFAG